MTKKCPNTVIFRYPRDISNKVNPRRRTKVSLVVFLALVISAPLPAFAYGDPSGGFLFQVLTPIVALLWGVWLVFAHNVHKLVSRIINKWRGVEPEEAAEEQNEVAAP